jgi:cytochrome c oxidase subunit 1
MTGRFLNETLGKIHFGIWFVAANLTFFPQHLLGLEGMRRRIANYAPNYQPMNRISTVGAWLLGIGLLFFITNLIVTWRKPRTAAADAWGEGNALEWATTSPPPPWNFDALPPIRSERPVFDARMARADAVRTGGEST